MQSGPELIVMLTKNDQTVPHAAELFSALRHTRANYFGFKDKPLSPAEMRRLTAEIHAAGKTAVFEVVEYDEPACLAGARAAAACGSDILMGTRFFDSVNDLCRASGMRYLPFVGAVSERPSVLEGTAEEMIREADACLAKGVAGFDLLGYRHTGDAVRLIREFVRAVPAPVCVAGSVNSFARLDELKEISPWAFTIGSAFFDGRFHGTIAEQIDAVCGYMHDETTVLSR